MFFYLHEIISSQTPRPGRCWQWMFVNVLLISVEKGKPIFPGDIFLPFVLEANNEHICVFFLKKNAPRVLFCFTFLLAWGGQETEQFKGKNRRTDWENLTFLLSFWTLPIVT